MSDSVQLHRRQPTRHTHSWDSLGKNTEVCCHFLLQCMKVKSEREVAQSCPTLSNHMDCSLPGSSIRGIFQARVLEWGAIAFSTKKGTTLTKIAVFILFYFFCNFCMYIKEIISDSLFHILLFFSLKCI